MNTIMRTLTFSVLCAAAACGDAPTRAGGDIGAITLRGTLAASGISEPGGDILATISTNVSALSNGAVEIDIADGPDVDDQDGAALQRVRDGDADIAVVRAGTFPAAGVTAFAALQAPFLIDNEEQAERVAADPITDEMLATLDQIGVVGLGVAPGGLRHPVGWNTPLVGLADYDGATINTRPSLDIDRMFAAFGATTDHSVGEERMNAAADGALRGIEVSLLQPAVAGAQATMTVNVTLYSKFDVVIVNQDLYNGLSDAQRTVLGQAVVAAIPTTVDGRPSEAEAALEFCDYETNAMVLAAPSDIDDLLTAADAVITELEQDEFNRRAIATIEALGEGTAPGEVPMCPERAPASPTTEVGTASSPAGSAVASDQSVINGTWRWEVTAQNLLDAGVPENEVAKDIGVNTFILEDGTIAGDTPGGSCYGTYVIEGNHFTWDWVPDGLCGGNFQGTFELDGDEMTFTIDTDIVPGYVDGWFYAGVFDGGLHRIGDVPE